MTSGSGERRALFVHSANELYGADIILLGLLANRPERWKPLVILPNDVHYEGRLARRLEEMGVPYREMKLAVLRRRYFSPLRFGLYVWYFINSTISLVRLIRREKIDVVHSNTTAVIPGAVAARLTGRPHVWHSHEMVISPGAVRKLTSRLAPALSDYVLTVSGAVRDHILETNPTASNVRVLHNGIDLSRYSSGAGRQKVRDEFSLGPDDVVVGMLGRISKGKGQSYLIDAASMLANTHPHLKYLLVGYAFVGQEFLVDDLRRQIADAGLEGRVVLAGYRADAPDVLSAVDICVLPSTLPDSFPTVVLEAMASSQPMIATDWGGAREMVIEGETGYLVPVDDASVLAERIAKLADSPDLRRQMGEAGLARARANFTIERQADEFWGILEELASAR